MASSPSQSGVIHASRLPTRSKRPKQPSTPGDVGMNTSTMNGTTPKRLARTPLRSVKRRKTEAHTLSRQTPECEGEELSEDISSSPPLPAARMASSPPLLPELSFNDDDLDMDISRSTPKRRELPTNASKINITSQNAATGYGSDEYIPSSPPLPVRPDANAYDFSMMPKRLKSTVSTSSITSTTNNFNARTAAAEHVDEHTDTTTRGAPPPSHTESATESDIPSSPPPRHTAPARARIRVRVRNNFIYIYESQHSRDSSPSAAPCSPSPSDTTGSSNNESPPSTRDPRQPQAREEPPIPPNSIFQGTRVEDTRHARRFEILCDDPDDGPAYGYEIGTRRLDGRPDDWIRDDEIRGTARANRAAQAARVANAGGGGFRLFEDEGESETDDDQEQEVRGRTMQRGQGRLRR